MIDQKSYNPLVSVVVIAYNSSKYVVETLESIKNQSYQNIELIISDDCSTDNTTAICSDWIEKNKNRFLRTKLICAKINSGISANCNQGISATEGDWIKPIAGDDILCAEIITDYIKFISENQSCKIVYSNVKFITPLGIVDTNRDMNKFRFNLEAIDANEQFQILLRSNPVWAATIMYCKEIVQKIKYDETYRYFEDLPFLQKVTQNGYKIYYLNVFGAYYRKHSESIQITDKKYLQSNHKIDAYLWSLKSQRFLDSKLEKLLSISKAYYCLYFFKIITNKKNCFTKLLFYPIKSLLEKIIKKLNSKRIKII